MQPLELRDRMTRLVLDHNYEDGPLLVLAGPGTGKTHCLIETIRRQLENACLIEDFFEATLTNAAADKFLNEVQSRISPDFESAKTLHFRAKGILHQHARLVNIDPGFTVVDTNCEELIFRDLSWIIELGGQKFESSLAAYRESSAHGTIADTTFGREYRRVQSFYSVLDWYDVVCLVCQLLKNNAQIRNEESNRYRFLLIDEYQDLNPADQLFVELLLNGRGTLIAVGDDDQSIYSSRYADPSGIVQFNQRYQNAKILQLPVSTRLPSAVISASNTLISRNENRVPKETLLPIPGTEMRAGAGFVISVNNKSEKAEKAFIFNALCTLINADVQPKEILVLCSCRALGLELITALQGLDKEGKIPIRNDLEKEGEVGAEEYLLIQLRSFILNHDNNLATRFILNEISGDYRDEEQEIILFAINSELSIWQALATSELNSRLQYLGPILRELREQLDLLDPEDSLQNKLRQLVTSFSPLSHLREFVVAEPDDNDKKENLQADSDTTNGVRFITLHSSKGLDGDFVFIPFMEEEIGLPADDVEEQRRLLYVALTRAKVGVVMSWAWSRRSDKRFKCSGSGGEVTNREASTFIGESGVNSNFQPLGSARTSPEAALDLLRYHSSLLMQD